MDLTLDCELWCVGHDLRYCKQSSVISESSAFSVLFELVPVIKYTDLQLCLVGLWIVFTPVFVYRIHLALYSSDIIFN